MLNLFAYPKVARVRFLPIYPILFPGLKNFNELAENVTKKDLCYFKPQKSIRQVWNDATAACSKLTKKTNQERLNVSTKLWENKDNVKTVKTNAISKKRRRESCESPLPTEQPKTKRPKLVLKAEKLIDSIPLKVLEENKRKLKTGFKLFQLANKEACIKKHGKSTYKFTLRFLLYVLF